MNYYWIYKIDINNFSIKWKTHVTSVKIKSGYIDEVTGKKVIFIHDGSLYYLIDDYCCTMSTYFACIDDETGNLNWFRQFSGSLDYVDLLDDSFIIVDGGENGALYKLSTSNELKKIYDFPWVAAQGYTYKNYLVYYYKNEISFRNVFYSDDYYSLKVDSIYNYRIYQDKMLVVKKDQISIYDIKLTNE